MRVHFVGERDDGISPSSHSATALAAVGVSTRFDPPAGADGWRSRAWGDVCRNSDVVHVVTYSQCNWMLLRRLWRARLHGVQIVRYWVGSDVMWARHHVASRRFARALGHLGTLNLAVADHLVDELAEVGIAAETTAVITPHVSPEVQAHPLPEQLTVLCYLPTARRAFYGGLLIDQLIRELPDVRFVILADPGTDYHGQPNVESPGFVDDLDGTLNRCTVVVRPTLHDGMPRMVLEMLARGRHVIASHRYPHCVRAVDVDAIRHELHRLERGCELNLAGRRWVGRHFETRRTASALRDRVQQRLAPGRSALRREGRRQGLQLLARCPWLMSRKLYGLPRADDLPPEAQALRTVLAGYVADAPQTTVAEPVKGRAACAC